VRHEDAFLQAILDVPDDDTPRLVYADWLDEHGEPARAEFIRAQCELAQMAVYNDHRPALQARQQRLLADHGREWLAREWPRATNPVAHPWTFVRGFVAELSLSGLGLEDAGVRALAATPRMALVATLDLRQNGIGAPGLRALAASPHLASLTLLDLRGNRFAAASLKALAASDRLPQLRELVLDPRGRQVGEASSWFGIYRRDVAVHDGDQPEG
jgi:uncharacterized protein (TIGR02996 family)